MEKPVEPTALCDRIRSTRSRRTRGPCGPPAPAGPGTLGRALPRRARGPRGSASRHAPAPRRAPPSDDDQRLRIRLVHRRNGNGRVERHQATSAFNRQGQKIDVRQLPGTQEAPAVHDRIIQKADAIRNEQMVRSRNRRTQPHHGVGDGQRVRIRGLRQNADAPVLRQWAGCPAVVDIAREPRRSRNRPPHCACGFRQAARPVR